MSLFHQPEEIIQGKYCITGVLGKGGVAVTYSAIALATNSPVAIKVISLKQLDNWKQVELFQREAEVLKQLDHPNIPDYIDYFDIETKTDKAFYLVQQLAPGKSLHQLVESGWRSNEKEVKDIAQQVLGILAYLHSLDPPVIHRDIKPHNLIRSDDGKIYLVDFGAVQNTYYNTLMQGSTVVGTYGYMAPEQFRGQALPATDLYSLGATLLYLLTHRSPAELPQDTLKLDFRSAVDISESFVEWLENILEPDAEDRFDSAHFALSKLFQGQKKNKKKLIAGIGAGVLAIALLTGLNSYKWFFLNNFGFSPSNLSSHTALNNYLKEGGNINYIENSELLNFIFYAIENPNIETKYIENFINKAAKNAINDYGYYSLYPRRNRSLIDTAIAEERYEIVPLLIDLGACINCPLRYKHTPIYRAIAQNKLDIAKLLIDAGADINIEDNTGNHLLFYSLSYGDAEAVKLLIENNAYVNVKDRQGDTLLIKAIDEDSIYLADFLIASGADINIKTSAGETALFYALDKKRLEIAKLIVKNGANVNAKNDHRYFPNHPDVAMPNSGELPLFNSNNSYDTVKILIENGADINAKNRIVGTPLSFYSSLGNIEIVEHLIKLGADVNAKDRTGRTPLFKVEDKEIAKLLIKNKADINIRTNANQTALFGVKNKDVAQILIDNGADITVQDKYGRTALFGVKNKDVAQILINNGVDITVRDQHGRTPLFGARDKDAIQLLIDLGFDFRSKDNYGRTPLFDIWDKEAGQLFIDLGIDINARDDFGRTALFVANNAYVINLLVDLGADINAVDNFGQTALFGAVKKEDEYIIKELIKQGLDVNHKNNYG